VSREEAHGRVRKACVEELHADVRRRGRLHGGEQVQGGGHLPGLRPVYADQQLWKHGRQAPAHGSPSVVPDASSLSIPALKNAGESQSTQDCGRGTYDAELVQQQRGLLARRWLPQAIGQQDGTPGSQVAQGAPAGTLDLPERAGGGGAESEVTHAPVAGAAG
jgi:hypothetical protein